MPATAYGQFEGIAGVFGYDATVATPRRKAPTADMRSEDEVLRSLQRDTLVSSARDAKRNWAIAAWMIRQHLDFVSEFSLQVQTLNKTFNEAAEKLIARWSERKNCHVAGRHPLGQLVRMAECCRTLDGDDLIELLKNNTINLIRGDRIRNPRGAANSKEWINGIKLDPLTGRPLTYQIHSRTLGGSFLPEKQLPARNAIHHGYFDDPEQVRGVSPLASGINTMRDVYEGIEAASARLKIEQILGVAVIKQPDTDANPFQGNAQYTDVDGESEEETAERIADENKRGLVDYGKGVFQWEMLPGEDVKTIAGNMPSSNAQAFLQICIDITLRAMDIPPSFMDPARTNFFGSRGALQLYQRSCRSKQAGNQELLDELTTWRLRAAIIDGELDLPRGWLLDELEWLWVPRGIPWWDRAKEVTGDIKAIAAGLDTPQNVCLEHGTGTFEDNVDALAVALQYSQEKLGPLGFALNFAVQDPQLTVQADQNQ
jgi:capsid protein